MVHNIQNLRWQDQILYDTVPTENNLSAKKEEKEIKTAQRFMIKQSCILTGVFNDWPYFPTGISNSIGDRSFWES